MVRELVMRPEKNLGPASRVVSIPSWELFDRQPTDYKDFLLQGKLKVSVEAGIEKGWHKYVGAHGITISIAEFGECGNIEDLQKHFGYTVEQIVKRIKMAKHNKSRGMN